MTDFKSLFYYFILVSLCVHGVLLFYLNQNRQIQFHARNFGSHPKTHFAFLAPKPPAATVFPKGQRGSVWAQKQKKNAISPIHETVQPAFSSPYPVARNVPAGGGVLPSSFLANPFGPLALPEHLLGQGFFPRKYTATFVVKEGKVELEQLTPMAPEASYLDGVVLRTFQRQLQMQSAQTLLDWVRSFKRARTLGKFEVILEFHEVN